MRQSTVNYANNCGLNIKTNSFILEDRKCKFKWDYKIQKSQKVDLQLVKLIEQGETCCHLFSSESDETLVENDQILIENDQTLVEKNSLVIINNNQKYMEQKQFNGVKFKYFCYNL